MKILKDKPLTVKCIIYLITMLLLSPFCSEENVEYLVKDHIITQWAHNVMWAISGHFIISFIQELILRWVDKMEEDEGK